ncbi:MAG: prephenate dehydrogenase/arogenate dehydrogenase family protein [Ruminococcus sp.]|nr:prephenate dehydrogenase/arogenate dehydrogenase family protein [Ruminococcus sp.]
MNIVIIGLGIIGGSFCKAFKLYTDHHIIGINRTPEVAEQALREGAIDEIGTADSLQKADVVFLCMYPQACIDYIEKHGSKIKNGAIVTDSSGIKRAICPKLKELSLKYGFVFVGSHPMAGKEKNGFAVSEAELYKGASFIITPCGADQKHVDVLAELALSIGFGQIKITTPEEHDRMIAFTSQLPHVLACAYVMSPSCKNHKGFSAGSYRDVSRVANINSKLWSELFLENREPLIDELDILVENIGKIVEAVKENDKEKLTALLEEGHKIKQLLGE